MNLAEMAALNNKWRNELTTENKAYYEDMLVYLRTSKVSQRQVEELTLEILDHLIEAQKNGQSAEAVFGVNLQVYCEELVQSLPGKTVMTTFRRLIFMTVILLTCNFLVNAIFGFLIPPLFGVDSPPTISPLYVMDLIACIVAVEGILLVVKKSVFAGNQRKYSWGIIGMSGGCFGVAITIAVLLNFIVEIPKITYSPWVALLLASIGFAILKFGMKNIEI